MRFALFQSGFFSILCSIIFALNTDPLIHVQAQKRLLVLAFIMGFSGLMTLMSILSSLIQELKMKK